ncbi:MAG: UDP-N-acetylglucosamine--N-acetylmuramyl-(pentapeptide) pyrophosphoryl-undecaprenol N-acetylglucosamine transferase [Spirochaetes bacterium]|nr:UDP-N-acetylglucosamine--N-acetylmuramyl-(pentapeptide) pyrophosphoryl-undecaprenol N-acetylglucosamine transferase [Spirochaetota bacterium]
MSARSDNMTTVAFTGGGTGGHVYPGIAVAERFKSLIAASGDDDPGSYRLVWIGSGKDIERFPVEAAGMEYFAIPSGKLRRSLSPANMTDLFKVTAGFVAALGLLSSLRPAVLFSKGGYVSVPPCRAAACLGIPVYTHESDVTPGLATRLNASVAARIFVSYDRTRELLPERLRDRVTVSGNPVRSSVFGGDARRGRKFLGIPGGEPIILVLGGSQGAMQVNELVSAGLPGLADRAFVVHQHGRALVPATPPDGSVARRYRPFPFIHDELPDVLAAASVVVGRSGAGIVWEAAALGKPMILIPLCGQGTRGDQVDNARYAETAGAAVALVGPGATPAALVAAVASLLGDADRLASMGRASADMAGLDGAGILAQALYDMAKREVTA